MPLELYFYQHKEETFLMNISAKMQNVNTERISNTKYFHLQSLEYSLIATEALTMTDRETQDQGCLLY